MDRGVWWAAVLGVPKSRTWLKQLKRLSTRAIAECGEKLPAGRGEEHRIQEDSTAAAALTLGKHQNY